MKGTILSIDVDGTETVRLVNGRPELAMLKAAIGGGYIEGVPGFDRYKHGGVVHKGCAVFCDEEGKLNSLPYNRKATVRWQEALLAQGLPGLIGDDGMPVDVLVGKVAVVWGDREFMAAL
jgi:hypothetical protein